VARMMCIRGKQHPAHTGLVAGQVYEVSVQRICGCAIGLRAFAQGSAFFKPTRMRCSTCGKRDTFTQVPWGPDRFVPWSDPKVSKKEVRELYQPSPVREKETL
jgi:hypothetical protein